MNWDGSWILRTVRTLRIETLKHALENSIFLCGISSLSTQAAAVVGNSFVFRWLTKEPDPSVIVIDLRETRTVGPVLAVLDWCIRSILPYWTASRLKRGLDVLAGTIERAGDSRPARWLGRLLEPPERPEASETGDES